MCWFFPKINDTISYVNLLLEYNLAAGEYLSEKLTFINERYKCSSLYSPWLVIKIKYLINTQLDNNFLENYNELNVPFCKNESGFFPK